MDRSLVIDHVRIDYTASVSYTYCLSKLIDGFYALPKPATRAKFSEASVSSECWFRYSWLCKHFAD